VPYTTKLEQDSHIQRQFLEFSTATPVGKNFEAEMWTPVVMAVFQLSIEGFTGNLL
jgi:hypothetical protein